VAYCTYDDVRKLCDLTTSEVLDADLTTLITYATRELNADIQSRIIREQVLYIDLTRQNYINGSNTTYYIRNWQTFFIGDANDDGTVNTSDITVYQVEPGGVETVLTVSSISPDNGSFVLSTAPTAGSRVYVTYWYSPVSMTTPHPLVVQATAYKAASLAFLKIDAKKVQQFGIGKLRITRQSEGFKNFDMEYIKTINKIKRRPLYKGDSKDLEIVVSPGYKGMGYPG